MDSGLEKLQTDMAAKGVKSLTGPEIKAAFSNNSIQGRMASSVYIRYTSADGTTKGRAWGAWGEAVDLGKRYINDQDQYCMEWFGKWALGKRCSVIYPGAGQNEYIEAVVSGITSKGAPDGIYRYKLTPADTTGNL